jgi:hypothetical protein
LTFRAILFRDEADFVPQAALQRDDDALLTVPSAKR